jgi:hypothetical protein
MAVTIQDIFEELLPGRISDDPELRIPAYGSTNTPIIQINAFGEVEGAGPWIIDLTGESEYVRQGLADKPGCTVEGNASAFENLWTGELRAVEALGSGELDVRGSMRLAAFVFAQYYGA